MLINLVVKLSLGQHLLHFLGRRFWSALKTLIQFLGRILLERNQQPRDARKESLWSYSKGDLFGLNCHIGKI